MDRLKKIDKVLGPELYDRFTDYLSVSQRTLETYTKALRQLRMFLLEIGKERCPDRDDLLAFRAHLQASGKKASTRQIYITAARLFFEWTAQTDIYPNIAEHIRGPKSNREHKKEPLTSKQTKELLSSIDPSDIIGARDLAMISLMVTGGLRTIEVSRADIGDIKTASDNVVIYIQGKGREEKNEYVIIRSQTEHMIRRYLAMRGQQLAVDAPLFCSEANRNKCGRLETKSIRRMIKKRLRDIGINDERISAHSLRHTAVTLSLLGGATIEEAQQFARHKNIQTTMIYDHALDKAKNSCSSKIEELIF